MDRDAPLIPEEKVDDALTNKRYIDRPACFQLKRDGSTIDGPTHRMVYHAYCNGFACVINPCVGLLYFFSTPYIDKWLCPPIATSTAVSDADIKQ